MKFVSSVQEVESELIENVILNYHEPISHKYEIKTTTPNGSLKKVHLQEKFEFGEMYEEEKLGR